MIAYTPVATRDRVLDFWRGVSILLVVFHHAVFFRFASIFKPFSHANVAGAHFHNVLVVLDRILLSASELAGPLGVQIFFVISGYIIAKLLLEEESASGRIDAWWFYIRRAFRILPAYFFFLLCVALFAALGWLHLYTGEVFNAAGFICNTNVADCSVALIHTWTLAVEQQFYLVWPLLFLLVVPRVRPAVLAAVFFALLIFSALGWFVAHGWLDNALSFACIAIGALYAHSVGFNSYMQRYGLLTTSFLIAAVALASLVFGKVEILRQVYHLLRPLSILTAIVVTYKLRPLVNSSIFFALSRLGLVSYSLYLWQELFLMEPANYPTASILQWPLLMIAFALFSFFAIERPAIGWAPNQSSQKSLNRAGESAVSAART